MPLEDLSEPDARGCLADQIAEAVTTDLASIRALHVVPRQSMKRYRETVKPVEAIGRELDVDTLIGGSVVCSHDRVHLTIQVIDVSSERHVWAQSYEAARDNVLDLQRRVAKEVLVAMRVTWPKPPAAR